MGADVGFAMFDTAIGRCAIAWCGDRVVGTQLPETSSAKTRQRMQTRFPRTREAIPPADIARVVNDLVALLSGQPSDLGAVSLDLDGLPPFRRRVYEAARRIPAGDTVTYGALARTIGAPGSARSVGNALGRNPFPIIVPCHRVVAANGRPGGFTAAGGVGIKLRILDIENAASTNAAPARTTSARTTSARSAPARSAPDKTSSKTASATTASAVGSAANPLAGAETPAGRLGFDPAAAVARLRRADQVLAAQMHRLGPFDLPVRPTFSVFDMLAEAIVHQQLSTKAAATIFGRLRALGAGAGGRPTPARILRASDDELRAVGLSRAKVLALQDLANRADRGALPGLDELAGMDDDSIVARLTEVRGIGRWSAEMFLIFRLGRPDVLPLADQGLRRGVGLLYGIAPIPTPEQVAELGERWRPYRTVASWYLWRAVELERNPAGG